MATAPKSTEAEISELSDQIRTLQADLAKLTQTMGEIAGGRVEKAKAAAAETMSHAQANALDAYAQAEDSVRRHPGTALGIAAGLGFLVGLLSSRHH